MAAAWVGALGRARSPGYQMRASPSSAPDPWPWWCLESLDCAALRPRAPAPAATTVYTLRVLLPVVGGRPRARGRALRAAPPMATGRTARAGTCGVRAADGGSPAAGRLLGLKRSVEGSPESLEPAYAAIGPSGRQGDVGADGRGETNLLITRPDVILRTFSASAHLRGTTSNDGVIRAGAGGGRTGTVRGRRGQLARDALGPVRRPSEGEVREAFPADAYGEDPPRHPREGTWAPRRGARVHRRAQAGG